jgi:hypothetical protein
MATRFSQTVPDIERSGWRTVSGVLRKRHRSPVESRAGGATQLMLYLTGMTDAV